MEKFKDRKEQREVTELMDGLLLPMINYFNADTAIKVRRALYLLGEIDFESQKDKEVEAIKALEQEPCEDAISRQAVIDVIERWLELPEYNNAERNIMRAIESILYDSPSVKPDSDLSDLLDALYTAKIYAGAEVGRLCNNNEHIDACVFQSVRDSIAQNIKVVQSYAICKEKSEE